MFAGRLRPRADASRAIDSLARRGRGRGVIVVSRAIGRFVAIVGLACLWMPVVAHAAPLGPVPIAEFPGSSASGSAGYSTSVWGDVAVVGAALDDTGGTNKGAAYVYVRSAHGWALQTTLVAPDGAAGDQFGTSVSTDGGQIVVGAPMHDVLGMDGSGAVYVFQRVANGWDAGTEVNAAAAAVGVNQGFGQSVSVNHLRLAVGSPFRDISTRVDQGAVYVFTKSGDAFGSLVEVLASDGAANDRFGESVSLQGATLVVGAPYADPGGATSAGAAYAFTATAGGWGPGVKLLPPDGATADYFGQSVSAADGMAAVGAPQHDVGALANAGRAYVFQYAGTWGAPAPVDRGTSAVANSYFGRSVALDPSGEMLLVGAYADTGAHAGSGAAYAFEAAGGWGYWGGQMLASDGLTGDFFGSAVSIGPDLYGGYECLVGAPFHYHGGVVNTGGANLFGIKPVYRFGGADRYEVASAVAHAAFPGWRKPGGAAVADVVIACGSDAKMADPLTASGLVGAYEAPLLLVRTDTRVQVPAATLEALGEIRAAFGKPQIHLVGGPASITTAQWNILKAYDKDGAIDRLGGADRYEVAYNVYSRMKSVLGTVSMGKTVLLACGNQPARFYDALAASPAAVHAHLPILLIKTNYVPPKTAAGLLAFPAAQRFIVGPPAAVTESVRTSLGIAADHRIYDAARPDRIGTAMRFADFARISNWIHVGGVGVANKVADCLTGGSAMGLFAGSGPLLFTDAAALDPAVDLWVQGADKSAAQQGYVFGGTASVSDTALSMFRGRLQD